MTTYNPNQPSNLNSTGLDTTNQFFNNYFTPDYTISIGTNDAILSWFEQVTGDKESAQLLAQTVINTAQQNREDPMLVLDQFMKLPIGDLNNFLALYLNTSRVSTSLLGTVNTITPNKYIARTIIW
jgi:hypothetical protein